ncbi:MAG: HlyD family efflux transporter periplasmic adaptor subunit [Planctomycetaceae bacterium]|nr:HlyD family efflux transporter periplasmic adaptor subunit [Planctomycetaceae bacterium]
MSTTEFLSSASRPLRLRRRRDVRSHPLQFGDRRYWGLKDPVSLKYYQLRDEEYRIYQMLEGPVSLEDIRRQFEKEFAPKRISLSQLQSFLGMLHGEGLLITDARGQAEELLERHRKHIQREFWGKFANPLAIRFRGVDPERFLNWLHPRMQWLLSPVCVVLSFLLLMSALLLVTVNFQSFTNDMPDFESFFGWRNAVLLVVVFSITKVLHELGHAISCRHFGGECHELGVMFLVFTPCLYVNVSDAWMLPNKWHRIAISGAGMYVEMILASIATFLWWFSEPGMLNALCLNIMVVCSVTTVLFNGNPLLRYDGYYMLADWVEVPNLRQQAMALIKQYSGRFFLGTDLENERVLPGRHRLALVGYALAAIVYRFIVLGTILWFIHEVLKPYRLEILAQVLAVVTVAGLVIGPAIRAVKFLRDPLRTQDVNWSRLFVRGGFVLCLLIGVLLIPFPHTVKSAAVIQPLDATRIYIAVDGTLEQAIAPGTSVQPGDELGQLHNLDLQKEVQETIGRINVQEKKLENLRQLQRNNPAANELIPAAEQTLADLKSQLEERQENLQRLTIKAPVAGTVLPPMSQPKSKGQGELPEWSGSPLEERNRNCFLKVGTLFCLIGDAQKMEAVLVIDQADVQFVREGQRVRLKLSERPGEILTGTVQDVAQIDLKVTPRELIQHEDLPTRMNEQGRPELVSTSYQARVALDTDKASLLVGTTGSAKIETAPLSLASRLSRYLNRTFRLDASLTK